MKLKLLFVILGLFQIFSVSAQVNPQNHRVDGYVRRNGTYVQPHQRTNANNTINDNYTTYPNVNPHTGAQGRIRPQVYTAPRVNNSAPAYPRTQRVPTYTTPRVYRSRVY